jgi:hypothetical protein
MDRRKSMDGWMNRSRLQPQNILRHCGSMNAAVARAVVARAGGQVSVTGRDSKRNSDPETHLLTFCRVRPKQPKKGTFSVTTSYGKWDSLHP